jgi:hypothetical protein
MSATLLIAMGIAVFGGVIFGLSGFGFGLTTVPVLLLVYPPATVTALVVTVSLTTGWLVLVGAWRSVNLRTVLALAPGATIGVVLGTLLIRTVEPAVIKLIAGTAVVLFALSLLRGWKVNAVHHPLAAPLAGVASGTLNTSTGMSGPPVVLLFTTRDYDMRAFRSSIMAYFYYVNILGLSLLIQQGIVGRAQLVVVLQLLPAAIAGGFVGRRLLRRFSQAQFRMLTTGMLLASGTIGIVTSMRSLLG